MSDLKNQTVLSILAHPDDAEALCAGTLIRLRKLGWEVHIATMTAGDCGSRQLPGPEIARRRKEEGRIAAESIGAVYHCLESRDLLVCYDEPHIRRTVALIRSVNPALVITHSPTDYMPDHEFTSLLARNACFAGPVPNFESSTVAQPTEAIPYLYYCAPVEGKGIFGEKVPSTVVIDISGVIEQKAEMLGCHVSQREWLKAQHGMDEFIESMKRWSADIGAAHGVRYAEGFRQHRGHAYPQDDLLGQTLGRVAVTAEAAALHMSHP